MFFVYFIIFAACCLGLMILVQLFGSKEFLEEKGFHNFEEVNKTRKFFGIKKLIH